MDRHHVVVATLRALMDEGSVTPAIVKQAIDKYGLDTERGNPWDR